MNTLLARLPLAITLGILLVAGRVSAQDENTAAIKRGAALVREHCAGCHAVGRTDVSKHKEAPAFRTLGKRYPIESLEEALAEGLISGHPDMPEFRFSAPDANAVIVYLQSIQQK